MQVTYRCTADSLVDRCIVIPKLSRCHEFHSELAVTPPFRLLITARLFRSLGTDERFDQHPRQRRQCPLPR